MRLLTTMILRWNLEAAYGEHRASVELIDWWHVAAGMWQIHHHVTTLASGACTDQFSFACLASTTFRMFLLYTDHVW